MPDNCLHIFTYGTLRDANINHKAYFLRDKAIYKGRAFVYAKLFKVTWYPAINLDETKQYKVIGDVFELPFASVEMILHELDGYEGIYSTNEESEEYERLLTTAYMDDGTETSCWIYNYKHQLDPELRIQSGDYLDYLKHQR